ncbi:hypothetical protein, partial [Endozoicomonas sp. ONNA2]|uniref:hypothetical protein n=1 Tax=Endozoicomonas sp. ONNA2 TaxID=2828741 RepID=UPI00214736A3
CPSNTTYKNSGCPWHGPINEILDHLDTCSNIPPEDWKTMMQHGRSEDAKTIKNLTNVVAELKSKIQEQNSSTSLLPGIQQFLYDLEKRSAANTCLIGSLQNEISTLQFKIDTLQLEGAASENLPLSSLEPLDEAASTVVNGESRTSLVNPPGLPATTRTLAVDTDFIGPTPDGCWIWRIDNFEHKRSEAQVFEEKRVIHSPEFNTRSGYKMRTRVYLDGNGIGRKTHISLFISLLKSKFDAALRWPLSFNVSFMIIDQLKGNHEIETGHMKFQRPIGDKKSFLGFPCILRLTNLEHGYVVDDTMFIKIFIKD